MTTPWVPCSGSGKQPATVEVEYRQLTNGLIFPGRGTCPECGKRVAFRPCGVARHKRQGSPPDDATRRPHVLVTFIVSYDGEKLHPMDAMALDTDRAGWKERLVGKVERAKDELLQRPPGP